MKSSAPRRAAACAMLLVVTACVSEPATVSPASPAIESFAEPGPVQAAHEEAALTVEGRPVKVDVWKPSSGARGLVVFSHGSMAHGGMYEMITGHLASRGYLVVAPSHYGDSLGTPATDSVYPDRVADLKFVLSVAESRADWKPFFAAGVAAAGHSIGGFDALALCGAAVNRPAVERACGDGDEAYCRLAGAKAAWAGYKDARVATCIGMTPFVHPVFGAAGEGANGIDRPVLLFGAAADTILKLDPYLRSFRAQMRGDDPLLLEVEGAGHLDFTDALYDGTIDHRLLIELVNAHTTAWLEWRLHGDAAAAALFTPEAVAAGAYGPFVTPR